MQILVIGSGDAFGSGGRAQTCYLLDTFHGPVLLDCGATALSKLKQYGINPDSIGTIFITHLHGDHFGGLVFLLREATLYKKRTKKLTIIGPPGLRDRLSSALEIFFPGGSEAPKTFEFALIELEERIPTFIDDIKVVAYTVQHPCGAPPYAYRLEIDGKVVAYTADTIWLNHLVEVGREADLFICEAYTWEKPKGYHLDYQTVLRRLPEIKPKRTVLTHLGPEMIARLSEIELEVAYDGLVIKV